MLGHNCSIESLSFYDALSIHDSLTRRIDFFLALNRMGRKRIMEENASRQDWVDVILNSQVHLDCLFYFLSIKPEILGGGLD